MDDSLNHRIIAVWTEALMKQCGPPDWHGIAVRTDVVIPTPPGFEIKLEGPVNFKPYYIDVPAHRILKITKTHLENDFEFIFPDGTRNTFEEFQKNPTPIMATTGDVLIVRNKDGKRFRSPRWHHLEEDCGRVIFLEEI